MPTENPLVSKVRFAREALEKAISDAQDCMYGPHRDGGLTDEDALEVEAQLLQMQKTILVFHVDGISDAASGKFKILNDFGAALIRDDEIDIDVLEFLGE